MANIAILVGNVDYHNLPRLSCCHDDLLAITQLLEATEKYEAITIIENAESDSLKTQLRSAIDKVKTPEELFFYFTGHGYIHREEFFHCAANFDARRPNETGLSTTELHTLLKLADASLVVKVIDSCYSGTLLVKAEGEWFPQNKDGFNNLIQIASCLESQNSLTGNPLSLFTEKFRAATLRKEEGPVFYTDIISTLRDEFYENNSQTPFFVSQHTAREQFVEDAARLTTLRKALLEARVTAVPSPPTQQTTPQPMTLLDRLVAADAKVVKPDVLKDFVESFFDKLTQAVTTSEFADFFELDISGHSDFLEPTAKQFIIAVMSKEDRADNFVTAKHTKKLRGQNPLLGNLAWQGIFNSDAFDESWDLELNCTMNRAQIKITLTPRFTNLRRVILVVSCAPSLDNCYIFEIATQHKLRDFEKYDTDGADVSRRWWKLGWNETTTDIIQQIANKLTDIVRSQLESAEKRLSPDHTAPARL